MPGDFDFIVADARIDLKLWDKAIAQMESDAQSIEKLLSGGKGIEVKVDEAKVKSFKDLLDDVKGGVTADVDVMVDDQKLKNVQSKLDDIDAGTTAEVDATNTEALAKIEAVAGKLNDLKKLATLQLILEVPDIISNIGEVVQNAPIISNLVELDTVLGQIEGRTGEMIPGAEYLIKDLYTNAWGESVTQIGEVITAAKNLGVTNDKLKSAVEQAFILESLGIGDATENLRTMDTMVKNELAPDFDAAADILVTGLHNGANRGQDLLDTFNEYGSTFATLGISGATALAFINSGLAAGIDNSDRIADSLRETGIRLAEMGSNPAIREAFVQLDSLSDIDLGGMWEDFQAGDIDGGQFYTAFFQALEDAAAENPQQAKTIAATLVGTIAEDFGIEAITQLSGEWDPVWGAIEDRSQKAAAKVNDNLGTAITELTRTIETDLVDSLNTALNLDDLVDNAKAAIQRLAAALREGKGLPEALEIALEMPGLADKISRFESVLANFIIDFLAGVASIGEALGQDMSGLRETVARFSVGQLEFDLQSVPPEEMRQAIETAMARGVSGADINTAIGNAIGTALAEGDVGTAQAIADSLKASMDVSLVRPLIEASGGVEEAIAMVQSQLDLANIAKMAPGSASAAQAQIEMLENQLRSLQMIAGEDELLNPEIYDVQINNFVAGLNQQLQEAVAAGDFDLARTLGEQLGIQNIDQFISEQQSQQVIDTLFPKPDTWDVGGWVSGLTGKLANTLAEGDYTAAADIASRLMNTDDPNVQTLIDDFATTLMIQFNNALAAGDTEAASDILTVLGLSPENNQIALDSMTQRLSQFSSDATTYTDSVSSDFGKMSEQITQSTDEGGDGITSLYDSILSEKGVLGTTRLDSLAKRFDAVAEAITNALKQVDKAESQVGEGAIEGAAVGGLRGPGVTMVGEAGREMIFSDERFAVLNNQTTDRLYSALSNMMGGGSSTVNNTRTVNYSPTVIVQNDAQAALFGSQSLNQLRGEAF